MLHQAGLNLLPLDTSNTATETAELHCSLLQNISLVTVLEDGLREDLMFCADMTAMCIGTKHTSIKMYGHQENTKKLSDDAAHPQDNYQAR